jgi:hypothetical protein
MLDVTRHRVSLHSDHSPWIILFDSYDTIGTARGDLLNFILLLLYLFTQCFGTGLRLDLYPIFHLDFILGLFRMLA